MSVKTRWCIYDEEPTPEPYSEPEPEDEQLAFPRRSPREFTIVTERRKLYTHKELVEMPIQDFKKLGHLSVVMTADPVEIRYVSNGDHLIPEGMTVSTRGYITINHQAFDG